MGRGDKFNRLGSALLASSAFPTIVGTIPIPGAQIALFVAAGLRGTGAIIKGAVYICRNCEPVYRKVRSAVRRAFCRDEFCLDCYGGMDKYVTSRGYSWD
jgi:hypothetical protein